MMLAAGLLALAARFFDPEQQKVILYCQVGVYLVLQTMLAGTQGLMIVHEQRRAGMIGTFLSILVAIAGAL